MFREGFRPDVDATESIRGSRAGELVARCMVEVGTSSYYRALGDAATEPALKAICRFIAGDELRHRSEEHTSELQSLMRISYAVFCLKKKKLNSSSDDPHASQQT